MKSYEKQLEEFGREIADEVISKEKGLNLDKISTQQLTQFLGTARLSTISKEETTIVDGKCSEEAIEARAKEVQEQIENDQSFYEKEKFQ